MHPHQLSHPLPQGFRHPLLPLLAQSMAALSGRSPARRVRMTGSTSYDGGTSWFQLEHHKSSPPFRLFSNWSNWCLGSFLLCSLLAAAVVRFTSFSCYRALAGQVPPQPVDWGGKVAWWHQDCCHYPTEAEWADAKTILATLENVVAWCGGVVECIELPSTHPHWLLSSPAHCVTRGGNPTAPPWDFACGSNGTRR